MLNLENAIINSALWAAAGDAVGWISELTDSKNLKRRAGTSLLSGPVNWKRKIGGVAGITAEFPAGSYSDDTQLRLSVSRAIRGDGYFDVEPFAKIELPVWLSYALGAGKGTKAAAINLTKRDVNWFSNYFTYDGSRSYVDAGGNGAAMRIQPHVWRRVGREDREYISDVVRDSLVTHGHMTGVCGAVFHADCLAYALSHKAIPGPDQWRNFIKKFDEISDVIERDNQLNRFWKAEWEARSKQTLRQALSAATKTANDYLFALENIPSSNNEYKEILEALKGFAPEYRGAGINTAIAAAALCWRMSDCSAEDIILCAVNAIGSDTDSIATMAGAIVGAVTEIAPDWPIQDYEYIVTEARRMYKISMGKECSTFPYPDLLHWQPPTSQADTVVNHGGTLKMMGLGEATSTGKVWTSGEFAWEWLMLTFGQSILCKRRQELRLMEESNQFPGIGRISQAKTHIKGVKQSQRELVAPSPKDHSLPLFQAAPFEKDKAQATAVVKNIPVSHTVEALTELVITSGFDPVVIGECFIECADDQETYIEKSVAFASIIVKAIHARKKRMNR